MADNTPQTTQEKTVRSEVVLRKLQGRVALEKYPDGYVVTFRGKREIVWVRWEDLKKLVSDFEEVLQIKEKKV